jgi:hypothetical protein
MRRPSKPHPLGIGDHGSSIITHPEISILPRKTTRLCLTPGQRPLTFTVLDQIVVGRGRVAARCTRLCLAARDSPAFGVG